MATELRIYQGVSTVFVSGVLDDAEGVRLEALVRREVPQGGQLIVDGSELTGLDKFGVLHLTAVQRWTMAPGRNRLPLAGLGAACWHTIIEHRGDFAFDPKPTLAEALRVYGVNASAAALRLDETKTRPRQPLDERETRVRPTAVEDVRRTARNFEPPTAREFTPLRPPRPDAAANGPVSRPPRVRRFPRRDFLLLGGGALALLLLVLGAWTLLAHRPPELSVSAGEIVVEEGGKEVEGVIVQVKRGRLVDPVDLPGNLSFAAPLEEGAGNTYTLQGAARAGARSATIQLVAQSLDGQKKSPPVPLTITVQPKPLAWQLTSLQSLALRQGEPLRAQSKFLIGSPRPPTARGLPPGLAVTAATGTTEDWQLTGTPSAAGMFAVTFSAERGGTREEKSCSLNVAAARPPAPSPPVPGPGPGPLPVDDGLRKFLLDRIERLPARYTQDDRENLRLVVRRLQQAKLVQRVAFEREGQAGVSPEEAAKLEAALQSTEIARLLAEKGCRIVVVGYASLTGSLSSNVRLSKLRAKAVQDVVRRTVGRNADLCGDYGPTDVVDSGFRGANRAVEVYAGTMDLPEDLRRPAERFIDDFNRRHGAH